MCEVYTDGRLLSEVYWTFIVVNYLFFNKRNGEEEKHRGTVLPSNCLDD
jgi:hypothetical protein